MRVSSVADAGVRPRPPRLFVIAAAALLAALALLLVPSVSMGQAGVTWTSQTSAADNT